MKRIAIVLSVAAVCFLAGWWVRRYHLPDAGQVVETRIDTVYYERPQPIALTSRPITVNVPRLLFAGEHVKDSCKSFTYGSANVKETAPVVAYSATTPYGEQCANNAQSYGSCSEIPNSSADSVAVALEIETRTYEDSLYRAQVSGPAVAGYRPSLDWIEVYGRTNTITRTETRRHRFAVTAGVGAAYTPRGFQPTVGVQVGVVLWGF
ncbi:DUF6808 domain-containing protein [uncultured Rikenella sp.]|uniref:DUF6808 domain-containing protein n=1 Tax=uncultured Rikenella sp. TaxID=368003 RepID=UPI002614A2FB|nr:hypothetical protein [uncultured Rikenella sp.]